MEFIYIALTAHLIMSVLTVIFCLSMVRANCDEIKLSTKLNEFDTRNFILRTIQVELKKRGIDEWPSQKQN